MSSLWWRGGGRDAVAVVARFGMHMLVARGRVVRLVGGQEGRVQFELVVQVEAADVEHFGQRRAAEVDLADRARAD